MTRGISARRLRPILACCWWWVGAGGARTADAQQPGETPSARAESLRVAGRPWHAAETLLAAAARESHQNAMLIVEGARAELRARRYDRARALLAGRAWLEDYGDGEALAVLAEAEAGLGEHGRAAEHFAAARAAARGSRAALLAVREGLAHEALGDRARAAAAFAAARELGGGLPAVDHWLRVRLARVVADTALAFRLLADLPPPATRAVPATRARALLAAGDSTTAIAALREAGASLDAARVALALRDSVAARAALYDLMRGSPETDAAAAAVGLALGPLPPRTPAERIALARAMKLRGDPADALFHAERAVRAGDSSAATLLLVAELQVAAGRPRAAERTYRIAARDPAVRPLALYRRARVLFRIGDRGALGALSGFADNYPADSAAPTALYVLGDMLWDRGDTLGAERWFGELLKRYPPDERASLARFRLAARAWLAGRLDSAAALYRAEVDAGGPQTHGARFWLGRIRQAGGDAAGARDEWVALAREDSLGYYGVRARREVGLPPLAVEVAPPAAAPAVAAGLARLDTLVLAGLDTEARAEVRHVLARPPQDTEALLAWSAGLAARGWGSAGVRLGWQAWARAPNDARALRAIYPWPNRAAVEAEAIEFGVDPLLFVAIVRQESVFDAEALSPAGARGLAQLMPGTAELTARGLDVTFAPEWITVPDLNLHLGAAHLADLLRRFGDRVEAAVAAYNAGPRPVARWLTRPGADDPDQFIELIPFHETRGYVRSVLRNRELYRVLYGAPSN